MCDDCVLCWCLSQVRVDVESTELALAFQLKRDDAGSDITALPQKQPVFAYLPLRSFGFRFIIQGTHTYTYTHTNDSIHIHVYRICINTNFD